RMPPPTYMSTLFPYTTLFRSNVSFCLAGHSERRHVLKESSELIARKAASVYAGGLTLIHCVGEKIDQRDAGQTLAVVQSQLDELDRKSTRLNSSHVSISYAVF